MKPNIKSVLDRVNRRHVETVFSKFADEASGKIPLIKFGPALQEMGIVMTPGREEELFKESDIDEDGGLDRDEFVRAISMPSELEPWASTLPLAKLLAACVEAALARAASADPLRKVAALSAQEIDEVAADFSGAFRLLLEEQVDGLKKSFIEMDRKAAEADGSNSKFQTFEMNVGSAENFHNGLADRVGEFRVLRRRRLSAV